MRRISLWIGLLSLLLACPAWADEDLSGALERLGSSKSDERQAAITQLLDGGEKARLALEKLLLPFDPKPIAEPTAEQRTEIAALIGRLADNQYKRREAATEGLIKLGRIATAQLKTATKNEDIETRTRAKRILTVLYPKPKKGLGVKTARAEAALLLADLGTRKSIPALRRTLETGDARASAAAAYALRAILHGGPSDNESDWAAKRVALLGAWRKHLEQLTAPTGAPAKLALRYTKGQVLQARIENSYRIQVDLARALGRVLPAGMPGGMANMDNTTSTQAAYQLTVGQLFPLEAQLLLGAFETKEKKAGGGGGIAMAFGGIGGARGGGVKQPEWKKGLKLQAKVGAGELSIEGKRSVANTNARQLVQFGILLALGLPGGEFKPGQTRELPAAFLTKLESWLHGAAGLNRLQGSAGRLTYLGKQGALERYWLQLRFQRGASFGGGVMLQKTRIYLQGAVTVDPARGLVTAFSLAGPAEQSGMNRFQIQLGGAGGGGGKMKEPRIQSYVRSSYKLVPTATETTTAPTEKKRAGDGPKEPKKPKKK